MSRGSLMVSIGCLWVWPTLWEKGCIDIGDRSGVVLRPHGWKKGWEVIGKVTAAWGDFPSGLWAIYPLRFLCQIIKEVLRSPFVTALQTSNDHFLAVDLPCQKSS